MLSYYFSILRRRALLVAVVTAVFAPIIYLVLTAGPTTYSSQAVIQVGTGDVTDDLVDTSRRSEEPERRLATELEVLTGRAVAEGAAERLRALGWSISAPELMTRVEATPRGGASAIGVVGTAQTPERAQELTTAYINAYISYRQDVNRVELERVRADLQQRLAASAAAGDSQRRYDTLAEWLEGVTLRLSVDTSGLRLISPASLPDAPTTATTPALAAVAALLGALLLGCAEALLVDLVRGSVRSREEAESLVPAPALVEIPRIQGNSKAWPAALLDSTHPTTAAARGLRLRLGGSVVRDDMRRLMIVGTERDGVDTLVVASALATSYGRTDVRVLLVADAVKGGGLEELLAGRPDSVDHGADPWDTVLPGVSYLPATTTPDGSPGFLDAHDPAALLDDLGSAFDVVILAMPPAPAEAEAVAVGHLVQAIVVVCALGHTPAKRLRRLVAALERSGSLVSGLALTTKGRRGHRGPIVTRERAGRLPVGAA